MKFVKEGNQCDLVFSKAYVFEPGRVVDDVPSIMKMQLRRCKKQSEDARG